jgi:hypothetical protein
MNAAADRTVVVSTVGLDDELAASIQQACEQAGALPVRWADSLEGGELAAEPGQTPGAVLAALAPGERQIPDPLVQFLTHARPGASLLLLCRESLVRPSVTLQHGRVTLVEPPFSVRRIASRLRVLLAAGDRENEDQDEAERPAAGDALMVREHRRPGHWMGLLAREGAGWAPAVAQSRGLTVVVPTASAETLARLGDLLAASAEPESLAATLPPLVGTDAGVIHLSARADEWVLFWPRPERPLWLCSTLRLPPCWDLAATAQDSPGCCFRVPAAGGDVVVALAAGLSDWALGAASPGVPALVASELADTVADGGPALLEAIAQRLRGRPGPAGALVIEAR